MKLYNTLTKSKETFNPLKKGEVKMYVCGITPYDTTHLGHAFTYTFFDLLWRYLAYQGYNVLYAQNVTDIDDDIIRKAREVDRGWKELGEDWTQKFIKDLKDLNITLPNYYLKATDSITSCINITQFLMNNSFAYANDGNVYFRTNKDINYGQLSRYPLNEMIKLSKERGANPNDPKKEHPLDFILWQKSIDEEPFWDSPWGRGRPGWHIECSAMIYDYLGEQIDIHGGGEDLKYPHHESEITQSENFTGKKPFVKYWLHTGSVKYEGEKMSKSLGNLIMVSELLKKYSADAIRFVLLSHHYQSSWEFFEHELDYAQQQIDRISETLSTITSPEINSDNKTDKLIFSFLEALNDNMNTPKALSVFMDYIKDEKNASENNIRGIAALLGLRLNP